MAEAANASTSNASHFRAKVYRLTTEGTWSDKGTGSICCEWLEQASGWLICSFPPSPDDPAAVCFDSSSSSLNQAEAHGLVIISEADEGTPLLVHKIVKDDIYQRTGGEAPCLSHLRWTRFLTAPRFHARPRRVHHHQLARSRPQHGHRGQLPGADGLRHHLVGFRPPATDLPRHCLGRRALPLLCSQAPHQAGAAGPRTVRSVFMLLMRS